MSRYSEEGTLEKTLNQIKHFNYPHYSTGIENKITRYSEVGNLVYTKLPLRHFNYHYIDKANGYYSNPNYYDLKNNNNSNNCNGLKKATNLGPSKVNHSPSRNVPISKQYDLNKSVKG